MIYYKTSILLLQVSKCVLNKEGHSLLLTKDTHPPPKTLPNMPFTLRSMGEICLRLKTVVQPDRQLDDLVSLITSWIVTKVAHFCCYCEIVQQATEMTEKMLSMCCHFSVTSH